MDTQKNKETFTDRETWKNHPRYPWYHISNHGNVYNTQTSRQLKPSANNCGYLFVSLLTYWHKNGLRKHFKVSVHQLVAETWCWPKNNNERPKRNLMGLEVNHIDFDQTNNRADNLEWVTHSQNMAHSWGRRREEREANIRNAEIAANCSCEASA